MDCDPAKTQMNPMKTIFTETGKPIYTTGFGHFQSSFWLGLEKIKRITALGTYELYIGMEDTFKDQAWAHYSSFKIGDAASKYPSLLEPMMVRQGMR